MNKRHLHSTTTIQLHLTAADYQRIRQDLASEFFMNKTTQIYARGLGQRHSLINTKLGSSAFISTTPGGSEPKTKDKEYKKLKTTMTTTHQDSSSDFFSKEKNSEKAQGCGIHSPRIFWRQESGPSNFCKQKQEARGLHSVSAIFRLRGCMPRNYSDDGLIQD